MFEPAPRKVTLAAGAEGSSPLEFYDLEKRESKKILDDVAKQWDAITKQVGVDKQKAVYAAWAAKSGAYPK